MNISYYLLELPPFVLLILIVFVFTTIGLLGTYVFRKYVKYKYHKEHNDIVEYIFAVLGGFHGLLLGFVVFMVWNAFSEAQGNANKEGSVATGLYREIKYFPDSNKMHPLMGSYINYVHYVLEQEYPDLEHIRPLPKNNRQYINNVYREIEKLDSREPRVENMLEQLNELGRIRSLRLLESNAEIPIEIWIPLLMSYIIIMIFAALVQVSSFRLHMLTTGLLGAFIGLVMFIILVLDRPFSGRIRIEPTEYENILMMHANGE